MSSHIIVVQGGPATGKTTLTQRLGKDLKLGVLMKDDIKELLFDNFTLPIDRNDSRIYGIAAIEAQLAIARVFAGDGKNFIIEAAFHTDLANADFRRLSRDYDIVLAQVFCIAEHKIQLKRYNDRIIAGQRHNGHHDNIQLDVRNFTDDLFMYQALDIEQTITYDTTSGSEDDYNEVVKFLNKFMEAGYETTN